MDSKPGPRWAKHLFICLLSSLLLSKHKQCQGNHVIHKMDWYPRAVQLLLDKNAQAVSYTQMDSLTCGIYPLIPFSDTGFPSHTHLQTAISYYRCCPSPPCSFLPPTRNSDVGSSEQTGTAKGSLAAACLRFSTDPEAPHGDGRVQPAVLASTLFPRPKAHCTTEPFSPDLILLVLPGSALHKQEW